MNMNWNVFEKVDSYFDINKENIVKCIRNAYSIPIKEWNKMSNNCKKFIRNNYLENNTNKKNLKSLEIII